MCDRFVIPSKGQRTRRRELAMMRQFVSQAPFEHQFRKAQASHAISQMADDGSNNGSTAASAIAASIKYCACASFDSGWQRDRALRCLIFNSVEAVIFAEVGR
jgi:hypothetical protein